jgi:hypothetical protein
MGFLCNSCNFQRKRIWINIKTVSIWFFKLIPEGLTKLPSLVPLRELFSPNFLDYILL